MEAGVGGIAAFAAPVLRCATFLEVQMSESAQLIPGFQGALRHGATQDEDHVRMSKRIFPVEPPAHATKHNRNRYHKQHG